MLPHIPWTPRPLWRQRIDPLHCAYSAPFHQQEFDYAFDDGLGISDCYLRIFGSNRGRRYIEKNPQSKDQLDQASVANWLIQASRAQRSKLTTIKTQADFGLRCCFNGLSSFGHNNPRLTTTSGARDPSHVVCVNKCRRNARFFGARELENEAQRPFRNIVSTKPSDGWLSSQRCSGLILASSASNLLSSPACSTQACPAA